MNKNIFIFFIFVVLQKTRNLQMKQNRRTCSASYVEICHSWFDGVKFHSFNVLENKQVLFVL